jgi:hypothetical protein
MSSIATARRVPHVAGLLAAVAAVVAAFGSGSPVSLPSTHRPHVDASGTAGGALPAGGTTAFDDDLPAVARLDPALLRALQRATAGAAAERVELVVNGGWRSPGYEDRLRREAVAKYGSEREAARWVATGTTSPHVSGDAVDVGPPPAASWLAAHGAAYGLCRVYANEPWHYELRPDASARGCPGLYADPTRDPRMRR